MDLKHYRKLIRNFFMGLSSREEIQTMDDTAMDRNFSQLCKEIWNTDHTMSQERMDKMTQDILSRVRSYNEEKRRQRVKWILISSSLTIAATLILAVFLGYRLSENRTQDLKYENICENGYRSVLSLPDGTIVHLNSASKLSYTSSYNINSRNVELSGEAYFEVAEDKNKPFTVTAGEMEIKVLGTKFNVKAHDEDNIIETTLVEGSICADISGQAQTLKPNERISYNRSLGEVTRETGLDPDRLVPWIRNEICFQHNTLEEIAKILERSYDVDVIIEDEALKSYSYTGNIRNGSLKNILEVLAGASSLDYTIEGNLIRFQKR